MKNTIHTVVGMEVNMAQGIHYMDEMVDITRVTPVEVPRYIPIGLIDIKTQEKTVEDT